MSYSQAVALLKVTSKTEVTVNAEYAQYRLSRMSWRTPLRFRVACVVIIDAAK